MNNSMRYVVEDWSDTDADGTIAIVDTKTNKIYFSVQVADEESVIVPLVWAALVTLRAKAAWQPLCSVIIPATTTK